ncbi:MAG: hypothetical protein WKF73_22190 [Nocardioidaceae bacterium]
MWAEVRAAREAVLAESGETSRGPWFVDRVIEAFSRAVGFDGYCLFGVDPVTGLRTVMFSRYGLTASTDRLVYNETVEHDLNRYLELACRPGMAGLLAAGVAAEPRSPRLHEILRTDGYTSELRLALVSDGRYWGALSLFRNSRLHPFDLDDAAIAGEFAEPLSRTIRRYQIGAPGAKPLWHRDGAVVFGADGIPPIAGVEAREWLAALAESWPGGAVAEDVDRAVVEVARSARETARHAQSCVRMPAGGWLVISAAPWTETTLALSPFCARAMPRL